MSNMSEDDDREAREIAAIVGSITGTEDVVQDIMSGRLNADAAMPLLAGLFDGAIVNMFRPIVGLQKWDDFDPTERPLTGLLTLLDGSRIRITLEEA